MATKRDAHLRTIFAIFAVFIFMALQNPAQSALRFSAAKQVGDGARYLAVGDINGDGKIDIVSSTVKPASESHGVASNSIYVLTGNGKGNFRRVPKYPVFEVDGMYLHAPVVADFDLDGKLDLSVLDHSSAAVSVLRGKGNGQFYGALKFATVKYPNKLAAGDITGDGIPDLVVSDDFTISVIPGKGDGTFGIAIDTPGAHSIYGNLAVVDVNHDHRADVAVTYWNGNESTVAVWLGQADGSLLSGQPVAIGGRQPISITAAELDGDGNIDLAIANELSDGNPHHNGNISVLIGAGDGTFHPSREFVTGLTPESIATADIDSDGNMDLITANYWGKGSYSTFSVLIGSGDGRFRKKKDFVVKPMGSGLIAPADANGDGKPDLIVVSRDPPGKIKLFLNKSSRRSVRAVAP